jgi:hypothetical protein
MLDYLKLWIYDKTQIAIILNNSGIRKYFESDEDGILRGIKGSFVNWRLQTFHSPIRLQISGSIHKYWNQGTNENDFTFSNAISAIGEFCKEIGLNPILARVVNLEFGVNLQLEQNASEIMMQLLTFKGHEPKQPYRNTPDLFFMEIEMEEYFLKIYDKGKQYRKEKPNTPNTLRIEVKAMKNRLLSGITTLADLQRPERLQVLGVKFATLIKGFVFEDDTISVDELPSRERQLFKQMDSKRFWKEVKGRSNSTLRKKIAKFKTLVEKYGQQKIYSTLYGAIEKKLHHLSGKVDFPFFTPNTYSVKTAPVKYCKSCGRDITHQNRRSVFCSVKFVGEKESKKCRNRDSNNRNNLLNKIKKINSRGVLFSIEEYIVSKTFVNQ